MSKISKVLVIGSGPIVSQDNRHSERSEESLMAAQRRDYTQWAETLRCAQGDRKRQNRTRVTGESGTEPGLQEKAEQNQGGRRKRNGARGLKLRERPIG